MGITCFDIKCHQMLSYIYYQKVNQTTMVKVHKKIKKDLGIDTETVKATNIDLSDVKQLCPFEPYTKVRRVWAWIGVLSVPVVILLIASLIHQRATIISLKAQISSVYGMNADCFREIVKAK